MVDISFDTKAIAAEIDRCIMPAAVKLVQLMSEGKRKVSKPKYAYWALAFMLGILLDPDNGQTDHLNDVFDVIASV